MMAQIDQKMIWVVVAAVVFALLIIAYFYGLQAPSAEPQAQNTKDLSTVLQRQSAVRAATEQAFRAAAEAAAQAAAGEAAQAANPLLVENPVAKVAKTAQIKNPLR